jgi:EAL domain-containing protein (putative c-di-GMP-specific phosphodiesterase class I)
MAPTSSSESATPGPESFDLRRISLAEHGLDAYVLPEPDQRLLDAVEDARARIGAQYAAIDILSPSRRLRVAGSPGVDLGSAELRFSVSNEVFRAMTGASTFYTRDAQQDPSLSDFIGELGFEPQVRFYAAAPLVGQGDVFIGALVMWSSQPRTLGSDDLEALRRAAGDIVGILAARRLSTNNVTRASGEWNIHRIIDEQAIQTEFQPIVHLETKEVVGFEALSRGPEGSGLEAPMALLAAAREVGRLGELDWLCRVRAVEQAAASGLPPSLAWFVNVEPAGLRLACPEHLRPAWAAAREQVRMVLEIVERDADVNAVRLVRASEQARINTWGVALDDVGAEPISLALLPILKPDVIKLDMSLLHGADRSAAASTSAAIHAYVEEHGAVVLAEGVESDEHEELAKAFGARFAQGFRYGPPGALPDSVPAPRTVVRLTQHFEELDAADPWHLLTATREANHATTAATDAIDDMVQMLARNAREPGLAIMCVGDTRYLTPEVRQRHTVLTAASALTVVLAKGLIPNVRRGYQAVRLPPDSELARYRASIILTVDAAAALVLRACTKGHPSGCTEYVYTQNRNLVIGVIRAIINATEKETSPDLFDVGDGSEPISSGETEDDGDQITSESAGRVGLFTRRPRRRNSRR